MRRLRPLRLAVAGAVVAVGVPACDTGDGRTLRPPTSDERVAATQAAATTTTTVAGAPVETAGASVPVEAFTLTAPWPDGATIPTRFTCDGRDRSPALQWTAPPAGTVELALVMIDDDVSFVHWALAGLPPAAGGVEEGAVPAGAIETRNDFGDPGWGGPCPPSGETHTYRFQLYALTQASLAESGADARALVAAIDAIPHTAAAVTGTYTRP